MKTITTISDTHEAEKAKGYRSKLLGLALAVFFATLFALPFPVRGGSVSFIYDASGNQSTQQTVNAAAPVITGQPNSKQVVAPGGSVGFSVNVASVLPVTYQWYFNGSAISGATGDSYFLTNFAVAMEGNYTVVVTNSLGSVTSAVATPYIDANGNGLPDSWEMAYFGNLNQTAAGDYDGDGISNIQEFYDGTDPTVRAVNYWIAPSGDFNTASNWSLNRVPGAGDTAVINTGTITLPANLVNNATQVTVSVPCTVPTSSDCILSITGNWTFNGSFTLVNGRQLTVTGGGSATVAGTTNLNGANLLVDNGSVLKFTNLTTYSVPSGQNAQWLAQHDGSILSFSNLGSIVGPATPNTYLRLVSQYSNGGSGATVSLPALTTITKADDGDGYNNSGVQFYAYAGGTISAPNLSTFQDNDSHPNSSLEADGTGVLALPKLLAPVGININVNAVSHPEVFTSLVGTSSFQLNAGTAAMSNLTSIAGLTFILANNGAQLSFPNVTTYGGAAGTTVTWQSSQTGSVLSFPNLTTITASATPNAYLNLITQYGAPTLNLPVLTTITKADDGDGYNNSGVQFNADDGVISAPNLTTFHDNDSHPNSSLYAGGDGTLSISKLLAPVGVNINLNAASHPEQFTSLVGTSSFQVNGGTVTMSNLNSIAGLSYILANNGAQLSFPNVTTYTGLAGTGVTWQSSQNGSVLSFPNLTTITGSATPNAYLYLVTQYGSPTLSLPVLTTITKADDGDGYNNSGVQFLADDGVISAPNLATFHDNDSHPNSSLYAGGDGTLSVPKLLVPVGININLNAASHPGQFTSLAGTTSFQLNGGTVVMSNLNSIAGLTFIFANNGAQLTFPNVTTYAGLAGTTVTWQASQNGSVLSFPNLTAIIGSATPNAYLDLVTQYGAPTLSLPALTTITKADDGDQYNNSGVQFIADDGMISAPSLATFHDNDSHPNSSLYAGGDGTLSVPKLLVPVGVNSINLNAASHPEQFTSLAGTTSFQLNGGTVAMSNLNSIAGLTFIFANNGAQLSFPNVTSYAGLAGTGVTWQAQQNGSVLSFPNLTTITGSATPNAYLYLVTQYGAPTLNLPVLTTITKADDGDQYNNSGVQFIADDGTISAPNLATFHDNDSHPNSSITENNQALVVLTNLAQSGLIGVTLNGIVVPVYLVPVITSTPGAGAFLGQAFNYQVTATHNPSSFGASGLPSGLSINPSTGLIAGSPTQAGDFSISVTATNAGGTGTMTLALTVTSHPSITSAGTAGALSGQAFTYQITATNNPTSFGATGLPAGLAINTATGLISGTPTQTGVYNIGLSATNPAGTGTFALTLSVNAAPVSPPVVTSALNASAQATVAFGYQITASNMPSVYGASGLPAGLTINTASGLISGTPTTVGTYPVTLSATNTGGMGTATLTLTVASAPVIFPTINSATSATTIVGYSFGYQITATNNPASYAASGLPAGLTINTASGLISGTPTTVGIYNISLGATNTGGTGAATLTLAVNAQPVPAPVITSVLAANGQATVAYSYQITASNSPVSFNASGLPAGLTVNTASGLISGAPTTAGVYPIVISAINSTGTGTATLALTVANPPAHAAFFTGEVPLSNGVYYLSFPNGNYFGYYSYLNVPSDPHYLYHFDMGYEYIFDAKDGADGVYFYDFKSDTFFYTSPTFGFPYLYDFTLNSVLYYYPDPKNPGHYNTNGIRYFYDYKAGKIIVK